MQWQKSSTGSRVSQRNVSDGHEGNYKTAEGGWKIETGLLYSLSEFGLEEDTIGFVNQLTIQTAKMVYMYVCFSITIHIQRTPQRTQPPAPMATNQNNVCGAGRG